MLPRRAVGFLPAHGVVASLRGFRKSRRGKAAKKQVATKERELKRNVQICIEEELPDDPEVLVLLIAFFSESGCPPYVELSLVIACLIHINLNMESFSCVKIRFG